MARSDSSWMRMALAEAAKGLGLTRPNPAVGCVLVRDGELLACGYHARAGGPHAERVALNAAGPRARGCDLYVTLEPCSTYGRTGPCSTAIIEAGIRRVVIGALDPNPKHDGRAVELLRQAGIEVVTGCLKAEAEELLAPFARYQLLGRPLVTLKLACSLDGKIADREGASKWITGPVARDRVQQMRREVDAILVGAETVRRDNPSLLPRPSEGRRPLRIVLDGHGTISATSKIFTDDAVEQTLVATTKTCPDKVLRNWERSGAEVIQFECDDRGRIALHALFELLGRRGVLHVLCEGGGALAAELIRQHFADRFAFFYAPCFIGGSDSCPSVGGTGWLMSEKPQIEFIRCEQIGADMLLMAKSVHN